MGGSGTYRGSASQNMWMLQKYRKIKGYASGGIVGDIENIIRGNGDDHLTINTLKKGEAVLDPSTTKIIQKLNTTAPMINNIISGMNERGNVKVDNVHVDINLPNVKSYKDFEMNSLMTSSLTRLSMIWFQRLLWEVTAYLREDT